MGACLQVQSLMPADDIEAGRCCRVASDAREEPLRFAQVGWPLGHGARNARSVGSNCCAELAARHNQAKAPDLTELALCFKPLFGEIAAFLASHPRDLVHLCSMAAAAIAGEADEATHGLWGSMYAQRWPAFFDAKRFQGEEDWRSAFLGTLAGDQECVLEVFDREKKSGYAMSAMPARVQYMHSKCAYRVQYISASVVRPEMIPLDEEHRLRFCPVSARCRLWPGWSIGQETSSHDGRYTNDAAGGDFKAAYGAARKNAVSIVSALVPRRPEIHYPYRVLEGTEGLEVGRGVELQWKMQTNSPFAWWFGILEQISIPSDGGAAMAVIIFPHFDERSEWYRLRVRFGDSERRDCMFGGVTGGIRQCTPEEQAHWMRFFPQTRLGA